MKLWEDPEVIKEYVEAMPKTIAATNYFRQAAFEEKVNYLYIIAHPSSGYLVPDPEGYDIPKHIVLRMLHRLKDAFAPDSSWEEIAAAPPRQR